MIRIANGQGFDPHVSFSGPTARIGVMEGDSALEKRQSQNQAVSPELQARIDQTRGHCDAILDPLETRRVLAFVLDFVRFSPQQEHLALELLAPEESQS